MGEASSYEFPSRALPLIEIGEDNDFVLNGETAALLSKIECPVCPVAVVGLYRTGKSTLLNMLRREFGEEGGFEVGSSVARCTRGIWVWGRPLFFYDESKKPTMAALLLDTEGIGGLEANPDYDRRIFALACLLASSLVYNSLGSVDEHAISQLSFVAGLADHLTFSPSSPGGSSPRSPSRLAEFMPSFTWVLRDFSLELESADGDVITADEYLEMSLRPQRGYDAGVRERNRIRQVVRSFFRSRACRSLSRPVVDEDELSKVDSLPISTLRKRFREELSALKEHLFENLTPKTLGTDVLRGRAFAEVAQEFCRTFNDGAIPTVSTAWDNVSRLESEAALEDAISSFDAALITSDNILEDVELETFVAKATLEAESVFEKRAIGSAAKAAKLKLDDATRSRAADFRLANRRKSRRFCAQLANDLYAEIVAAELDRMAAQEEEEDTLSPVEFAAKLESAWATFKKRYEKEAKGPDLEASLLTFVVSKWPASCRSLATQIETLQDRKRAKEAAVILDLKKELAEQRGTSKARSAVLEDAQESLQKSQLDRAKMEAKADASKKQLKIAKKKADSQIQSLEKKIAQLEIQLDDANQKKEPEAELPGKKKNKRREADVVPPDGKTKPNCNCSIA